MAIQGYRRDTAANIATQTPAQGDMIVDTTNNRVIIGDGATIGGFAAAKLSDLSAPKRTAVADAAYTALATDREIAYTSITAARTITLPLAASYPAGYPLTIVDEGGSASQTNSLTVAAAGADTISGRTSAKIGAAFGFMRLACDGVSRWTVIGRSINIIAFTSSGTYTPTPGLVYADVYAYAPGGAGGGGALVTSLTTASDGAGGGAGGAWKGTYSAAAIGASVPVTVGVPGIGGAAATTSTTNGVNGGGGSATSFGSLLVVYGGMGGVGGQAGIASAGGSSGGILYAPAASSGSTVGGNSANGQLGGSGATGSANGNISPVIACYSSGGGGSTAGGVGNNGGVSFGGATGGGSGSGGNGGFLYTVNGAVFGGSAGVAAPGSPGNSPATNSGLGFQVGTGGGGGAHSAALGYAGGAGGPSAGGGGAGNAVNGGVAGPGGNGGGGLVVIVEHFS